VTTKTKIEKQESKAIQKMAGIVTSAEFQCFVAFIIMLNALFKIDKKKPKKTKKNFKKDG